MKPVHKMEALTWLYAQGCSAEESDEALAKIEANLEVQDSLDDYIVILGDGPNQLVLNNSKPKSQNGTGQKSSV